VIRPERIGVEPADTQGPNRVPGLITNIVYLGSSLQLAIQLASGHAVTAMVPNTAEDAILAWAPGMLVSCHLPPAALRILASDHAGPGQPDPAIAGKADLPAESQG